MDTLITNPWKVGTQRYLVADCLLRGLTREETFAELVPSVINQVDPLVFKTRVSADTSIPIASIPQQAALLFFHIARVRETIKLENPDLTHLLYTETEDDLSNYNSMEWRREFIAQYV